MVDDSAALTIISTKVRQESRQNSRQNRQGHYGLNDCHTASGKDPGNIPVRGLRAKKARPVFCSVPHFHRQKGMDVSQSWLKVLSVTKSQTRIDLTETSGCQAQKDDSKEPTLNVAVIGRYFQTSAHKINLLRDYRGDHTSFGDEKGHPVAGLEETDSKWRGHERADVTQERGSSYVAF